MHGTMPPTAPGVQYFGAMSFILDALKKSENSRLRQDHPAIFDAQAAAVRRQGLPRWGIALIVLLVLNLLILGYALWRPGEPASSATAMQPEATTTPTGGVPVAAAPTPIEPARSTATPASVTPRSAAPTASRSTPQAPLVSTAPPAVRAEETPSLPTRDDLLASGAAIPEANLNMHVYDATPALRFVLLNGQRLREGEVSREGLRVEQILPDGVLLSAGGNSFMLSIN